jgi:hypothetical protein
MPQTPSGPLPDLHETVVDAIKVAFRGRTTELEAMVVAASEHAALMAAQQVLDALSASTEQRGEQMAMVVRQIQSTLTDSRDRIQPRILRWLAFCGLVLCLVLANQIVITSQRYVGGSTTAIAWWWAFLGAMVAQGVIRLYLTRPKGRGGGR